MLLRQTGEYALRAMAMLASRGRSQAVRAADLAAGTGVPLAYLSKVMRRLAVAGLVHAAKGHGGGFSLARDPATITFFEILDAVECAIEPGTCAFGWGRCDPDHPCPLHPAWSRISEGFLHWTESTTLASIGPWDPREGVPAIKGAPPRATT